MKKTPFLLAALICIGIFSSCMKDNINPDDVRIEQVVYHSNTTVSKTIYVYDAQGRIIGLDHSDQNNQVTTESSVYYNGSEVLIVLTPQSNGGVTTSDSIWLTLDGSNKATKRIRHSFYDFFGPNQPQKTYIKDTTTYTYDGSGLLLKLTTKSYDTTWTANSGTYKTWYTEVIDNTNGGGNLLSSSGNKALTFWSLQSGVVHTSSRTHLQTDAYGYDRKSPNQMDFKNMTIITEHYPNSGYRFNKNYANLPDKVTSSYTDKDENGAVISSSNDVGGFTYRYNKYGFLSAVLADPPVESERTEYIYNK